MIVHRGQQERKIPPIDSRAVVEAALQIGHEQSRRHSFAGHVSQHEPDSSGSQVEEIVIVATDGARLNAFAGVIEGSQGRSFPGEEFALHRGRDSDFLQQGFIIGARRQVQVPDVDLPAETLHPGVTRSGTSGQADPDHAKDCFPLAATNLKKFTQHEGLATISQTSPQRGDVNRVRIPGPFWTG